MFTLLTVLAEAEDKKKKAGRSAAAAVYHRDYVKTRNRPYRKYKAKPESSEG